LSGMFGPTAAFGAASCQGDAERHTAAMAPVILEALSVHAELLRCKWPSVP
jgi:hypothetical protein